MPNRALKSLRAFYVGVAATDATKDLIASPGVGRRLVFTRLTVSISTTAAQIATIASTGATVVLVQFGASTPIGTQHRVEFPASGLALPENEALRYITAAAGYLLIITGEYYVENLYNAS